MIEEPTAVTVSMQRTNDSDVKYLESENEYSFHNCPKRSCLPGILAWLKAKYPVVFSQCWHAYDVSLLIPSKKRWMVPAKAGDYQQAVHLERRGLVCACARTQNKPQYGCFVPRR